MSEKVCTKCNTLKLRTEFYRSKKNGSIGLQAMCKGCYAELRKVYYLSNILTPEQIEEMKAARGFACDICLKVMTGIGTKSLHVDHCHTNGHVRGMLCPSCNRAIGLLRDDPDLVSRAASYLRKSAWPKAA